MTNLQTSTNEEVVCPFCKKSRVNATIKSEYYSYNTSHISAKNQKIPVYHPERIEVHSNCPSCGASKADIKDAIRSGSSGKSHEERLEHLKKGGIPTSFEDKVVHRDED